MGEWNYPELIKRLHERAHKHNDGILIDLIDVLEIELLTMEARIDCDSKIIDEERELARLQRALNRIEAIGGKVSEMKRYPNGWEVLASNGRTWALQTYVFPTLLEAVEKAADLAKREGGEE